MGRRATSKKPPPPESVDWKEYRPDQAQYWMYKGPWIAPEDIPPDKLLPEWLGPGLKSEGRRKYVRIVMEEAGKDLVRQTARYLAVHDKGMDGIEPFLVENWRQRVHCGSVKPGEPDPVSQQLASCYRSIRYSKGRIKAGDEALNGIERDSQPLFHWKS